MDFNTLRDQVSNLTIYDLKAGVRKVQNGQLSRSDLFPFRPLLFQLTRCIAVMNFTEMEAKVREATNNEPWGASSSENVILLRLKVSR